MTRRALAVLTIAALSLCLTACLNAPSDGVGWLRGQRGIVSAEIVDSDSSISGTSGSVRGELDPKLSDDDLASLVASIANYVGSHDGIGFRLGIDGVDFVVGNGAADNDAARELWGSVVPIDGIVTGLVQSSVVHARTLRPDIAPVLARLDTINAATSFDIEIEGFRDESALTADTADDNETGGQYGSLAAVQVTRPAACDDSATRDTAETLFERPEIDGATLALCDSFTIYYSPDTALSSVLPALQQQLIDAGLDQFPVTANENVSGSADGRSAVVTPVVAGDPAGFSIFAPFEAASAPDAFVTLFDDRSVEIIQYDTPLADLVALVQPVSVASSLPFIRVEGTDAAVGGVLADLGALSAQAVALAAASPEFANVELNVDAGTLDLSSPVATDPDIPAAVAALRASGATTGRTFSVSYLQTQLTITPDGVATAPTDYTDGHVVIAFADEWNATR